MKKYLSTYLNNDYGLIQKLFLSISLVSFGGHILFYYVLKYGFHMRESFFLRLSMSLISLGFLFINRNNKLNSFQIWYFEIASTLSLPVTFNVLFFLNDFSPYWSASIFFAALLYGSLVNPTKALILWPIAFLTSLLLLDNFFAVDMLPENIITAFQINFGAYFLMFLFGIIQVILTNAYKQMKKLNLEMQSKNTLLIEQKEHIQSQNKELQEALDQVKQLKGLIPICANCKKVRDDKGYWNQIESYIEKHSDAQFSHGICQECTEKLYGDEFR